MQIAFKLVNSQADILVSKISIQLLSIANFSSEIVFGVCVESCPIMPSTSV